MSALRRWLRQIFGDAKEAVRQEPTLDALPKSYDRPSPTPPTAAEIAAPGPEARSAPISQRILVDPFIAIDVETTGLSPKRGHRIVSLGLLRVGAINGHDGPEVHCLHLVLNPGRKCDQRAFEVHGLTDDFLSRQDSFEKHAERISQFISGANLVGHNVDYDLGFLDAELSRCGMEPPYRMSTCTMTLSRAAYPGQPAKLDDVSRRLGIDVSARAVHHGALVDAAIAAQVYAALKGGVRLRLPSPLPGFANERP